MSELVEYEHQLHPPQLVDRVFASFDQVCETGMRKLNEATTPQNYTKLVGALVLTSGILHLAEGNKIRGAVQTGLGFTMVNQ